MILVRFVKLTVRFFNFPLYFLVFQICYTLRVFQEIVKFKFAYICNAFTNSWINVEFLVSVYVLRIGFTLFYRKSWSNTRITVNCKSMIFLCTAKILLIFSVHKVFTLTIKILNVNAPHNNVRKENNFIFCMQMYRLKRNKYLKCFRKLKYLNW